MRDIALDRDFHDEGYGFDAFGLHPPSLDLALQMTGPLYNHYFRVDSVGAEHIPADGPAILVANHGGILPLDAAILGIDVLRQARRVPRLITDHFVPRLPIVSTLLARLGVVSGTRANVKYLLERGELVAIWPEGVSGPAKPFRERYQIQRWSVGFAELAIRHRAPVIPVAIVGAEESWPLLAKVGTRVFGAPYIPVPIAPIPLPTKLHVCYGEPLLLHAGYISSDAEDPAVVSAAAGRARRALEDLLIGILATRRGVFR